MKYEMSYRRIIMLCFGILRTEQSWMNAERLCLSVQVPNVRPKHQTFLMVSLFSKTIYTLPLFHLYIYYITNPNSNTVVENSTASVSK